MSRSRHAAPACRPVKRDAAEIRSGDGGAGDRPVTCPEGDVAAVIDTDLRCRRGGSALHHRGKNMVGDGTGHGRHRRDKAAVGKAAGVMHAAGDRSGRLSGRLPWCAKKRQFLCKPGQNLAHGPDRRLEQGEALGTIGIDDKVGRPVLDMKPLVRAEQAGLKTGRQRRVHLRRPCRHGSGGFSLQVPERASCYRIRSRPRPPLRCCGRRRHARQAGDSPRGGP